MTKLKLFIENFLVYGLGGVIDKLIPFVMLPIITRLMPDAAYFGISDLASALVAFGGTLAIFGMNDAMYRMFFEKDDRKYKTAVCSTALLFVFIITSILILSIVIFQNPLSQLVFSDRQYSFIVQISAASIFVSAIKNIGSAPTRMQNKKKLFLVISASTTIISYICAILLLVKGCYLIALPIAAATANLLTGGAFILLNHKWFRIKSFDLSLLEDMLKIAIPLVPNMLIYWVFNSCDKLMIAKMLSVSEVGIYSAGSKIGHASQLVYTAFAGGWQFFVFSTMRERNQIETNSKVFEYLGIISFGATAIMCVMAKPIFLYLLTPEYYRGHIVVPYLFLAPLMQMLFQVAGSQFLIEKKTWPNLIVLFIGLLTNLLLNTILIPIFGIEGAALATLAGYIVTVIITVCILMRIKKMCFSQKFLYTVILFALYLICWRMLFAENLLCSSIAAILFLIICTRMYLTDIRYIISLISSGQQNKKTS